VREQVERRVSEFKAERQKGQQLLAELEGRQAELRQTLLRISGAIQVLEELLAGAKPGEATLLAPVSDVNPGYAATLAASLGPGGRLVLALNNPYSAVADRHVTDYFDSGAVSRYRGLWESGIRAYYHHRTLEDYLDAFHAGGLRLAKLADVPSLADAHRPDAYLPPGGRFPRFMLLAFTKP
jgi:hypothetical protein